MPDPIADAIGKATSYLTEHSSDAAYTDSAAVATVKEGLRVIVRAPDGRTIETDMPASVGGGDTAPSPGWLLRAAHASCDATLIMMRAAMLGIGVTTLEVSVDSESNDLGILGIDPSVSAGPASTRVHVQIAADGTDAETLRELVRWADEHCPVADAVRRAVPCTLEVETD